MFDVLLIANRGEIACRVMRTARDLGIRTVAVYSDADANALHVRSADQAVCIGPAPAQASYLNVDAILEAARATGADAIHPGYGFLSENADFADACERAGVAFVGPTSAAIRAMGSKIEAKRIVEAAGTPVVPGYQDDDQEDATLARAAKNIGYPLLIKASAGGGGKGMRLVEDADGFEAALAGARREAQAAFGNDRMLLERYLTRPKHLEVQILADQHGNTIHLNERDCSVQRRHQKVIEEAPGPTVDADLRNRLGDAAIQAARAIDYVGAGTVEFISEGDSFYFMEMNTRLQVEHPITEATTGVDLVEWQLKIAAGERLDLDPPPPEGHAIEVRVYAENPANRFLPSTGRVERLRVPGNVRFDAGVEEGDDVSVHYDPMIGKLVSHGLDREAARRQMIGAIEQCQLAGLEHNLGYLKNLLGHPTFVAGDYDTHVAEAVHEDVVPAFGDAHWALGAMAVAPASGVGWARTDGWRLNTPERTYVNLKRGRERQSIVLGPSLAEIGERKLQVARVNVAGERLTATIDGEKFEACTLVRGSRVYLMLGGATFTFDALHDDVQDHRSEIDDVDLIASPMPGQVVSVAVAVGDTVKRGQLLLIIEAMKMEHSITAPRRGTVEALACAPGQRVDEGVQLVELK